MMKVWTKEEIKGLIESRDDAVIRGMKRIYDFSRNPAARNYTIHDLRALKGSGQKLSMANPVGDEETRACVEAGVDLFVVGADQIEDIRRIAPTHFT